ncbi:MAG: polyprenyl synthetase family protein [Acidimicrobiia bacterium]|nr:polyprenyl synthetase family protein [Acidimicrobiia bacterium]
MDVPSIQDMVPLPHVWEQIERTETRLMDASESRDPFLTKVAQHLLAAGGKRFRPLLALIAADFGPANDDRPIEAGVAVELIHVGSLYHDDVIDEATIRRGADSANANWDNTVAILAGDFLMARASEVAATHLGQESVRLLASTYAELVEGQTRELQLDFDLDHDPEAYFQVIGGKTAALIRTSARLGAMAADADDATVEALSSWAWELGLVFQIADDALDLVATESFLGKPAGSDIREGKMTLPVLLAAAGSDGGRIRDALGKPPYDDARVNEVISIVRAGGYVEQSLQEAERRIATADAAVATLPDIPTRAVLSSLAQFLLDQVTAARSG